MERLTRRICGGWGLVEGCEINTSGGMRRIVERLAAYENTGLAPEEVAELANDSVKVVRCKDCKYWRSDGFWDGFWCFVSSYPDKKVPPDHFCGCGEKR